MAHQSSHSSSEQVPYSQFFWAHWWPIFASSGPLSIFWSWYPSYSVPTSAFDIPFLPDHDVLASFDHDISSTSLLFLHLLLVLLTLQWWLCASYPFFLSNMFIWWLTLPNCGPSLSDLLLMLLLFRLMYNRFASIGVMEMRKVRLISQFLHLSFVTKRESKEFMS